MNATIVIDQLVRQTMVLIAQVATSGGIRAPLAHLADQVFRDLTQALEEQGVRRKVAADMFGLGLRSYQHKVRRLSATTSDTGRSLWEAIYGHIREREVVGRGELLLRFAGDEPAVVLGVVDDMVESGLVYRTGRGDATILRLADRDDLDRAAIGSESDGRAAIVWALVYQHGPIARSELSALTRIPDDELEQALTELCQDGRVAREEGPDHVRYRSARIYLQMGEPMGWEAGLIDHFGSVCAAMCTKLRNGFSRALPDDELGGSTFTFDIWPGHPHEETVRGLLRDHRRQLSAIWNRVSEHNAQVTKPGTIQRVTLYLGQYGVEQGEDTQP